MWGAGGLSLRHLSAWAGPSRARPGRPPGPGRVSPLPGSQPCQRPRLPPRRTRDPHRSAGARRRPGTAPPPSLPSFPPPASSLPALGPAAQARPEGRACPVRARGGAARQAGLGLGPVPVGPERAGMAAVAAAGGSAAGVASQRLRSGG